MRQKTLSLFNNYYSQIGENYFIRLLSAIYLFDFLDRLKIKGFPSNWYNLLEKELSELINVSNFINNSYENSLNSFDKWDNDVAVKDIQAKTGEIYFNLWKDFKKEEYYIQAYNLLKERLEKNNIFLSGVTRALDDGCGGGRYTLVLKKLGCSFVIGIDASLNSIKFAKKMNLFNKSEVYFTASSVLELPFESEFFDFVFCNGVLHHTQSTEQGLKEIYRVLKKGSYCWLYLYGGKASFFWDTVDLCRKLLTSVPQQYTQTAMKVMGYPPGRIFHRTDFFYVPINNRYFSSEVEELIENTGFINFTRLKRGAEHDWDEILYNNSSIDPYIYSEGEMRYLIFK